MLLSIATKLSYYPNRKVDKLKLLESIVAASLVTIQVGSSKINSCCSILWAARVKSSRLLCASVQTGQRRRWSRDPNFTPTGQPYYIYSNYLLLTFLLYLIVYLRLVILRRILSLLFLLVLIGIIIYQYNIEYIYSIFCYSQCVYIVKIYSLPISKS